MTALEILKDARELVAAGWCRLSFKKLQDGKVCYCAAGAVNQAGSPAKLSRGYSRAYRFLINAMTGGHGTASDVYSFNDNHSQEDVLKAFDVAISNCKRRKYTRVPLRTAR